MTSVQLDGNKITSEAALHRELSAALDLSYHYGANMNALWDVLTRDVERPLELVWHDADKSRAAMPDGFDQIVGLMREVEQQDRDHGWAERFTISLR